MFKILKRKWYNIVNEKDTLTKIRVGDIRFTITKRDALKYNKNFPHQLSWTDEQVKLREDIRNNNYNPKNEHPKISKDNVCFDGHHRLTSLLAYYGEDYMVDIVKSKFRYYNVIWLLILTFPIIRILNKGDTVVIE